MQVRGWAWGSLASQGVMPKCAHRLQKGRRRTSLFVDRCASNTRRCLDCPSSSLQATIVGFTLVLLFVAQLFSLVRWQQAGWRRGLMRGWFCGVD